MSKGYGAWMHLQLGTFADTECVAILTAILPPYFIGARTHTPGTVFGAGNCSGELRAV